MSVVKRIEMQVPRKDLLDPKVGLRLYSHHRPLSSPDVVAVDLNEVATVVIWVTEE